MLAEERRSYVLRMMKSGQPVKVKEISARFDVSESTIRRDLQELGNQGIVKRTYGGAVPVVMGAEPSFREKEIVNIDAKKRLAKAAAALIEDGDCVLLDAGTTMVQLAREIAGRAVTVVTNSMDVATVFYECEHTEVILIGGYLRKQPRSLVGPLSRRALTGIRVDKAFVAANGVHPLFGASTHNTDEAGIKREMLSAAHQPYLIADSSKLGKEFFAQIAELKEFDAFITDDTDNSMLDEIARFIKIIRV